MAFSSGNSDQDITGINVTPLVDIMLVLLIVFMVTAKLVMSQAMPLDLPKAASAGGVSTVFTVSVDDEGNLTANGMPISDAQALRVAVQAEMRSTPDLRAVIAASVRTPHGNVMGVLDGLRDAGLTKVAFAAEATRAKEAKAP
jgi:biopolymer transport protein TolR